LCNEKAPKADSSRSFYGEHEPTVVVVHSAVIEAHQSLFVGDGEAVQIIVGIDREGMSHGIGLRNEVVRDYLLPDFWQTVLPATTPKKAENAKSDVTLANTTLARNNAREINSVDL